MPLYYDPTLANFKDRFEMLSARGVSGHVISITDRDTGDLRFGNFQYHRLPLLKNKWLKYWFHFWSTIRLGVKLNKIKQFDHIQCYDPLFFGFEGLILKLIIKSRLIIEVNGHYHKAGGLEQKKSLKRRVVEWLLKRTFRGADKIKFLNDEQMHEYADILDERKACVFGDFVATHVFDPATNTDEKYIFFMGHPFDIKGVDVLIDAFKKISADFPDVKLKIVGHCHGGDAERQRYVDMTEGNPNIEISKAVYFDEAVKLFERCTFFVLPSRTEAMGRVLIEAMAAGKTVIGSAVGGIPLVIEEGYNGLLFESENSVELAEKMRILLSDVPLRDSLAQNALKQVDEKFSSHKYVSTLTDLYEECGCE